MALPAGAAPVPSAAGTAPLEPLPGMPGGGEQGLDQQQCPPGGVQDGPEALELCLPKESPALSHCPKAKPKLTLQPLSSETGDPYRHPWPWSGVGDQGW